MSVHKKVTLKEVARQAGVSEKTVSLVVNHKAGVAAETRQRILAVADQLGYAVSADHIPVRDTVGVIVPYIGNHFYNELVQLTRALCGSYHVTTLVGESGGSPGDERKLVEEMVYARVGGIVSISPRLPDDFYAEIAKRSRPVVILNRPCKIREKEFLSSAVADTVSAANEGMKYLLANGHRKIVYLAGPKPSTSDRIKRKNYDGMLSGAGIQYASNMVVEIEWPRVPGWPSMKAGHRQCRVLIERAVDFDALLCYNDETAVGAMSALADAGIHVPDKVSVVGFGGSLIGRYVRPSLTSVGVQTEDMVWVVARQILSKLRPDSLGDIVGDQWFEHAVLKASLMRRGSSIDRRTPPA
jgi:LacI family transcriptional regulator